MLEHVKKYGTIIIIAILFAFFSFSIVDLVVEKPDYEDHCRGMEKPMPLYRETANCTEMDIPEQAYRQCDEMRGYIDYTYGADGCPVSYECNTCNRDYDLAGQKHRKYGFIITGILGVLAIMAGLYIKSKDEVVDWIFSGFLIGGILSVFIGTMSYFRDMDRFIKPVVLLLEMALIIWIALKISKRK